jgi:N utilization substance protein B
VVFEKLEFTHFCSNFRYSFDEFAWEIVEGTGKNLPVLDKAISTQSTRWRIERMPRVDLTILRMAAFEILVAKKRDVPKTVAINEAIELSKRFGSEDSSSFVNGILDHIDRAPPTP